MTLKHTQDQLLRHYPKIIETLKQNIPESSLPLYASTDIRINEFKSAVVDTNLFPAGFNNLCQTSSPNMPQIFKKIITQRVPHCQNILILAENHTRNTWYLENIYTLQNILTQAGFIVDVAALLHSHPEACKTTGFITLTTATGKPLILHCLDWIKRHLDQKHYDFVLLNNDLSTGVPEELLTLNIPIYPSYAAGWHAREKSKHFKEFNSIISDLAHTFDFDPFYLTTSYREIPNITIQNESHRHTLFYQAEDLYCELETLYKKHNITQSPLLFLKANKGTYGMGVIPIEHPKDILELNRKARNKLTKGKESLPITDFILQEGIPSSLQINNQVAELCLYFAANNYLGGFFRVNNKKSGRENLNSSGMSFQKIHHTSNKDFPFTHESPYSSPQVNIFSIYQFLALASVYAAHKELHHLEASYA